MATITSRDVVSSVSMNPGLVTQYQTPSNQTMPIIMPGGMNFVPNTGGMNFAPNVGTTNTSIGNPVGGPTTNIGTIQQYLNLTGQSNTGKIFQAFNAADDVISNVKQKVTETMWSSGDSELTGSEFYINPSQISSSVEYYVDTYCYDPTSTASATPQFSFGFADRFGLGTISGVDSPSWGLGRIVTYESSSYSPTSVVYSQYRNLVLPPSDEQFTMGNGQTMNSLYAINFARNRMKERVDPGNWELTLKVPTGAMTYGYVTMIDDAGNESLTAGSVGEGGRIYNIVSGSITDGPYLDGSGNKVYMGLAYPDMGFLFFNATSSYYSAGSTGIYYNQSPTTDYAENNYNFWTYLTDADAGFKARNSQEITSTYYFIRIKHNDFNFSNNPSFVSGTLGDFRHPIMINNPSTYITTVGLYNDANELLSVAKLSQPMLKTFERESLIRVKLDF